MLLYVTVFLLYVTVCYLCYFYSFFNLGARLGCGQDQAIGLFTPWQQARYPLYRRLD